MIRFLWIVLTCFSLSVFASDLLKYLPQDSKIVILGDVRQLNRAFGASDLFSSSFRIQELASQAALAMQGLDQDCYMLLCKTPLKEEEFTKMLQKGGKVLTLSQQKTGKYVTHQLSVVLPDKLERQSIYVTFLAPDIVLLSNENLPSYLKFKTGLSSLQRQWLSAEKMLCGYILPDRGAVQIIPAASQTKKVLFDASLQKEDALGISIRITPARKEDQEQLNMQMQQVVLLLGMMLNSVDPQLTQEFTHAVEVRNDQEDVMIQGNFSRNFIERFTEAVKQLASSGMQSGTNPNSPAKTRKDH